MRQTECLIISDEFESNQNTFMCNNTTGQLKQVSSEGRREIERSQVQITLDPLNVNRPNTQQETTLAIY